MDSGAAYTQWCTVNSRSFLDFQLLRSECYESALKQQLTTVQQVEEGSRKLDLQWEAHTARLKRAVRGPVVQVFYSRKSFFCSNPDVQEGERLAEALLTNHQVCQQQRVVTMILMKFYLGAGESGEPGGRVGGQAAPPHLDLPYHHGQAWWGGKPQ